MAAEPIFWVVTAHFIFFRLFLTPLLLRGHFLSTEQIPFPGRPGAPPKGAPGRFFLGDGRRSRRPCPKPPGAQTLPLCSGRARLNLEQLLEMYLDKRY